MTETAEHSSENDARRATMAALARASRAELESAWDNLSDRPTVEPVRGPDTGLVMMRGRIGGGGAPFNFGEATVTRATMRLSNGEVGHAHVLGTDHRRAELAAIFDALWLDTATRAAVDELVAGIGKRLAADAARKDEETAATRVDFFTMVRGED